MTILEELDNIESDLSVQVSGIPEELIDRLSLITNHHSRINNLIPIAKKNLRQQKLSEIGEKVIQIAKENRFSAKVQNAIVDSICIEEQFLVDRLDRLRSSCQKDIDVTRSILSYTKEEIRNNIQQ